MKFEDVLEQIKGLYLSSDESVVKVTLRKKGKRQYLYGVYDYSDKKRGGHFSIDTGEGESEEKLTRIPMKCIVNVELVDKRSFVAFLNAHVASNNV